LRNFTTFYNTWLTRELSVVLEPLAAPWFGWPQWLAWLPVTHTVWLDGVLLSLLSEQKE
jgi:hypothetical protein